MDLRPSPIAGTWYPGQPDMLRGIRDGKRERTGYAAFVLEIAAGEFHGRPFQKQVDKTTA